MKKNFQSIIIQAEQQLSKGEISISQYNQLLSTVVQLIEQDKIKEAKRAEKSKCKDSQPNVSPTQPSFRRDSGEYFDIFFIEL